MAPGREAKNLNESSEVKRGEHRQAKTRMLPQQNKTILAILDSQRTVRQDHLVEEKVHMAEQKPPRET